MLKGKIKKVAFQKKRFKAIEERYLDLDVEVFSKIWEFEVMNKDQAKALNPHHIELLPVKVLKYLLKRYNEDSENFPLKEDTEKAILRSLGAFLLVGE